MSERFRQLTEHEQDLLARAKILFMLHDMTVYVHYQPSSYYIGNFQKPFKIAYYPYGPHAANRQELHYCTAEGLMTGAHRLIKKVTLGQ